MRTRSSFRLGLPALALLLTVSFLLQGSTLPDLPDKSLGTINADELRMHIEFLASPELGGRYTLSPQLAVVNRYLASRLRAYGFKGAVEGSFLQEYDVRRSLPKPQDSLLTLTSNQGTEHSFRYGEFVLDGPSVDFQGEVVFVGYGISAPEQGHDDYADLDLQGKVAFALSGGPAGMDDVPDAGEKSVMASRAGAAGFLSMPPERFLRVMRRPTFKRFILSRDQVSLVESPSVNRPSAVILTPDSAAPLLTAAGLVLDIAYDPPPKFDMTPRSLGIRAEAQVAMDEEIFKVANVAGILEGSDPGLKDQHIVISAHQDHLETRDDGTIFPGADDDASGVAAVLEIAQSFAAFPPRRSILVMFHSGEEEGLLGSRYNTDVAPAVPLESIVANLNMDMIGRSKGEDASGPGNSLLTGPNGVYVIGADRISRQLHDINISTNQDFEKLDFDYTLNDPSHPSRLYYRSDHWNYGKHEVPFIFFFSGIHEDYHRPSDTVDKIDFAKTTAVARHIFALAWRLATMEERVKAD
ncbi:MAG TPA: M28 family peptidase [Acidobacteriota bacterium]|nr:M28 family peptidase [Acidobacteriota bacterium]